LVKLVQKAFDAQISFLDRFAPTPPQGLAALPWDLDHMLSRTLNTKPNQPPTVAKNFVYGPRASTFALEADFQGVVAAAGVDRSARAPEVNLERTRDARAAGELVSKLVDADGALIRDSEAHNDVPGTRCFEQKADVGLSPDLRFTCYLSFDRYVAWVWSPTLSDVKQRAAAQYAVLVNSQ
jgi:hypothetical protein